MSDLKIEGLWAAARERIRRSAPAQLVVGVALGLVVGAIDCGSAPKGTKCDVRTPLITVAVFGAWLILVVLWNVIVRAPRDVARANLLRARSAEATLTALEEPRSRNRAIRDQLAAFIASGDRAWNAAWFAHEIWKKENRYSPGDATAPRPPAIPDWSPAVLGWVAEVGAFLSVTPELGSSHATLFGAQEADLGPGPNPEHPLSVENRTEQDMQLIRLKQKHLRGFIQDLKD